MTRNRLATLLVATGLLVACSDEEGRRGGPDGGLSDLDGGDLLDSQVGDMDGTIRLPDGRIVEVAADGAIVERAADGAIIERAADGAVIMRQPDGAIIHPIPDAGMFSVNDAGQVLCGKTVCQCSDGIDQDRDGLIDSADPECIGAADNDESSFATGISGDNRDEACQDCFFDGNSGSGNDGCRVATSCLRNQNDTSSGRGNCNTCTATEQCRTSCQAYTPNGCDCFGCCTVTLGTGITKSIALAPGCDISGTTTTGCTECVPSPTCQNTCARCELCPGKTRADLPADCFPQPTPDSGVTDAGATPDSGSGNPDDSGVVVGNSDGGTIPPPPPPACELNGVPQQACGAGLPACRSGEYCAFGCCILAPLFL